MFCVVSGEVPKEPVVVKSTGLLFEKRLLEKILREDSKCPITNTHISADDILEIKANTITPSRASAPSSVPALLHTLQQEWDEQVLETFALRQQLDQTRKELAHTLYQYDAACRVIARLMRERDEAQHVLRDLKPVAQVAAVEDSAMDVAPAASVESTSGEVGVSDEVAAELNAVCKSLSSTRKGRKPSDHLLGKEAMAGIVEVQSFSPHKTGSILSMAARTEEGKTSVLTGGSDKSLVLTDLSSGKALCKLSGHKASVSKVAFAGPSSNVFSASDDNTVKMWSPNGSGGYSQSYSYGVNARPVDIAVHPSAHFLAVATADQHWHFVDVHRNACLKVVAAAEHDTVYHSCAFHPDGLILGTGTQAGALKIWDIREQKNVSSMADHRGAILDISFSENGYLAATASADGSVKIWDLRKLACTKSQDFGSKVQAVSFDYSGVYLGVGSTTTAQVKIVKDWQDSAVLSDIHSKDITSVAWGEHASSLITASLDRSVKVFGAPR